jgi:hypothetical protein
MPDQDREILELRLAEAERQRDEVITRYLKISEVRWRRICSFRTLSAIAQGIIDCFCYGLAGCAAGMAAMFLVVSQFAPALALTLLATGLLAVALSGIVDKAFSTVDRFIERKL